VSLRPRTVEQYHRLRRLAADQAGKPEGATAGGIADKLLAKHPELANTADPDRGARQAAQTHSGPPSSSGGPFGFMEFMKTVAREFGLSEFDTLLADIEGDFPGLIDEVVRQATEQRKTRPKGTKRGPR